MKQSSLRVYKIPQLLKLYDNGKLTKTQQLDVLLDKLYSAYIRSKSKRCVLQNIEKPWHCSLVIHNGHVFSRTCLSLKYNELNTYPQCSTCNYRHSMGSDHVYYHRWLEQHIGQDEYNKLEQIYKSGAIAKYNTSWYIDKIAHYREIYENVIIA